MPQALEVAGEVHVDHSLHFALERMGAAQLDTLPVVSRADVHKLEGNRVPARCLGFLWFRTVISHLC
jgi:hypothetical protein